MKSYLTRKEFAAKHAAMTPLKDEIQARIDSGVPVTTLAEEHNIGVTVMRELLDLMDVKHGREYMRSLRPQEPERPDPGVLNPHCVAIRELAQFVARLATDLGVDADRIKKLTEYGL
jgi:hypothetical protein